MEVFQKESTDFLQKCKVSLFPTQMVDRSHLEKNDICIKEIEN